MKKLLTAVLLLSASMAFTGCGSKEAAVPPVNNEYSVSQEDIQNKLNEEKTVQETENPQEIAETEQPAEQALDVQ